jgi:hypothetical protein
VRQILGPEKYKASKFRQLWERCEQEPSKRPSFRAIWRELVRGGFEICAGVDESRVHDYVKWIKEEERKEEGC